MRRGPTPGFGGATIVASPLTVSILRDVVAGERGVPDLAVRRRGDAVGADALRRLPGVDLAGRRIDAAVDAVLPGEPEDALAVEGRGVEVGVGETPSAAETASPRCVAGSKRTIAFCPPSVIQAARSGPTMTPCGAESGPSGICSSLPVFGSRMPSAPCALRGVPDACRPAPARRRADARRAARRNKRPARRAPAPRNAQRRERREHDRPDTHRRCPPIRPPRVRARAPALGRGIVGRLGLDPGLAVRASRPASRTARASSDNPSGIRPPRKPPRDATTP